MLLIFILVKTINYITPFSKCNYCRDMEYLSQIEHLLEVLSFFVAKLPTEKSNKDVFVEFMNVVNKIVSDSKEESLEHVKKDCFEDENDIEMDNSEFANDADNVVKEEVERKEDPVKIKFQDNTKKEGKKQKQSPRKKPSTYPKFLGSLPKDDEVLLFNCIFCDINFETSEGQKEHDKIHHMKHDNFFCPECTFHGEVKIKVMHHFTTEHKNLWLRVCSICKEGYQTTSWLRRHVLDAHQKQIDELTCPTCFDKFDIERKLAEHMKKDHIHGNFVCRRIECKEVKEFESKAELETHFEDNHKSREFYTCHLCGKEIKGKWEFTRHVQIHSMTVKEFKCNECDKEFYFEVDLNSHKKAQHGEKRFLCSQCDFQTRKKNNLHRHMIISHCDEENFQCHICMKRFKIERYLQKHMLSHSDLRAFKCDFCGKGFKQSKHLHEHKKIHTGVGRAYCNLCDRYFNQKYNLKLHNVKFHASQID